LKRLLVAVFILLVLIPLSIVLFAATGEDEKALSLPSVSFQLPGSTNTAEISPEDEVLIISLAEEITVGLNSDYERLSAVYDWVTHNITYDLQKAENLSDYGSGALYALENRSGVCHDYAELTKALLMAVGIEATYERGDVLVGIGEYELHAWNEVLISGTRYALDTTWGSGFMLEDGSEYIQKPRRIYLTTPEELSQLHNDPVYKQEREEAYMLEVNADKQVVKLSAEEENLIDLFNQYREKQGLTKLTEEKRLKELVQRFAEESAEATVSGLDIDLDDLGSELSNIASGLNISSAGMHALVKWLYPPMGLEETWEQVVDEQNVPLSESKWKAVSVGVVQKGDLLIYISIFVDYH
jgi:hypothetical protein